MLTERLKYYIKLNKKFRSGKFYNSASVSFNKNSFSIYIKCIDYGVDILLNTNILIDFFNDEKVITEIYLTKVEDIIQEENTKIKELSIYINNTKYI